MNSAPISLVIPLRDEEENIRSTISNIEKQTLQPAEIIFVDGGSQDQTANIIKEITKNDSRCKVLEIGAATPGRGRNAGIGAATMPWIALTDAGIRLHPDWIKEMWQVVERKQDTDFVLGNLEADNQSFFEECAALSYMPPNILIDGEKWCGPWIASALVKKKVWEEVGGFPNLRATEDLIFIEKVKEKGFVTNYAPRALVYWRLRKNLSETFYRFSLYSKHNAWAGRQRFWHYGILRQYLVVIGITACGFIFSPLFAFPLLWIFLRVFKNLWRKREQRSLLWLLNPFRFAYIAVILLVIDAATFYGWFQSIICRSS